MPYIKQEDRESLAEGRSPKTSGELNYAITMVAKEYLDTHGLSYATINDIVGALESAKIEFYRRIAGTYEDVKIVENSDVYDN